MDVARTRLTADIASVRQYTGLVDCLRKTASSEGIPGLYKGLTISLAGIIPYLAISLALYDTLKDWSRKQKSYFWSSPIGLVALGSVAAVVSQTVAYPMDTVRRHMQVSGAIGQESRYHGTMHCIATIYKTSGISGFYRGVFANGLRAAPQTGIEFACYDLIKGWLDGH